MGGMTLGYGGLIWVFLICWRERKTRGRRVGVGKLRGRRGIVIGWRGRRGRREGCIVWIVGGGLRRIGARKRVDEVGRRLVICVRHAVRSVMRAMRRIVVRRVSGGVEGGGS